MEWILIIWMYHSPMRTGGMGIDTIEFETEMACLTAKREFIASVSTSMGKYSPKVGGVCVQNGIEQIN